MKNRKWSLLLLLIAAVCLGSCTEWGQQDAPSGNQKKAADVDVSAKLMASFTFENDSIKSNQGAAGTLEGNAFTLSGGVDPVIEESNDTAHGKVLHLKGGYVAIKNPMQGLTNAVGASIVMWVKMPQEDLTSALVSFLGTSSDSIYFTGNACLKYEGTGYLEVNNPSSYKTKDLSDGSWHNVAFSFTESGFSIYIDGTLKYDTGTHMSLSSGATRATSGFDYTNISSLIKAAPYIYIGYGGPTNLKEAYVDDIKIYENAITDKDVPKVSNSLVKPIWSNTFENGVNDCQIIGTGEIVTDADSRFGKVFQNVGGALRTNYLLLPSGVLSHSVDSKELSIGFWVNASKAGASDDYAWAPLFMAYGAAPVSGANTWPMLSCQYRGVLQINCSSWCDFTDAQNVKGANTLYNGTNDWLADHAWHYYTAVFTSTTAKVYIDGALANEWDIDGISSGATISGLFSNGGDLKYVCLGGNQAWNWGDNDPGFAFDDVAIYNVALTVDQIKLIISKK